MEILTPNETEFVLWLIAGLLAVIAIFLTMAVNAFLRVRDDVISIKTRLEVGNEKHKRYDERHRDHEDRIRALELVRNKN